MEYIQEQVRTSTHLIYFMSRITDVASMGAVDAITIQYSVRFKDEGGDPLVDAKTWYAVRKMIYCLVYRSV